MQYSKDRKSLYIANIKKLLAMNPDITLEQIRSSLESIDIHINDLNVISRLRDKVYRSRIALVNQQTLRHALGAFTQNMQENIKELWKVALTGHGMPKIIALKEIRESHEAVFQKYFDAGVFEKSLGKVEHHISVGSKVEQEKSYEILEAMYNYGLLRREDVIVPNKEEKRLITVEQK